ncbi:MAG: hypothetical protein GY750_05265 [Lentisphaerae bacterium]|nr:hypothetical protein [Lentisphaerota bacterium]MCP4100823.1 hypothetical protein [Lentisphaerota bacterium]
MKFQRKAVIIEAIQFTNDNLEKLIQFMGKRFGEISMPKNSNKKMKLTVTTLEDCHDSRVVHVANEGDWIVKGVRNEFYPCKPDIFLETHDIV